MRDSILKNTTVYTDEFPSYNPLTKLGYLHHRVPHQAEIYVMGHIHTQTIDSFWSQIKRGIDGVYHHVSPKYLQHYVNE